VYQLGQSLIRLGIEVVALVPHEHPLPRQERFDDLHIYRFPYFVPHSKQRLCYGAGIVANLRQTKLARLQLPLYSLAQLIALVRLVRRLRIDVVNSHWLVTQGLNAAIVRRWLQTPHVCTIHAAGLFALRRIRGGNRIARFIVRNTDYLFTVSSFIKRQLDDFIAQDTSAEVLPMGIQLDRFAVPSPTASSSGTTLLCVGRLVEKKGIQYLLEALRFVLHARPDTTLMLVGDGPLRQQLHEQARRLGIERQVQFLGWKSHEAMPALYAQADLVVVPSIVDASGETEGMPVVVLEAMAAGKLVVASNVSGIPDVIEDGVNGFLIEPKSAPALAACIVDALQHLDKEDIQRRAQVTATRYDWQAIATRYAEAFQRIQMSKAKQ
jgi:glycosyltransferase involved in cell wall biosynthesis